MVHSFDFPLFEVTIVEQLMDYMWFLSFFGSYAIGLWLIVVVITFLALWWFG